MAGPASPDAGPDDSQVPLLPTGWIAQWDSGCVPVSVFFFVVLPFPTRISFSSSAQLGARSSITSALSRSPLSPARLPTAPNAVQSRLTDTGNPQPAQILLRPDLHRPVHLGQTHRSSPRRSDSVSRNDASTEQSHATATFRPHNERRRTAASGRLARP
jgi:hypothetical protein